MLVDKGDLEAQRINRLELRFRLHALAAVDSFEACVVRLVCQDVGHVGARFIVERGTGQ